MTETKEEVKSDNLFETLNNIDVSKHLEAKGKMNLKYLSWVWAWQIVKNIDPEAKREYTKFPEYDIKRGQLTGREVDYCKTDTGTYVECSLTIKGHIETETLFVMDFHNKAVLEPTQDQINKAKQRCFVKAAALHGLGLYVYAGEDLPEQERETTNKKKSNQTKAAPITNKQKSDLEELFESMAQITGKPIIDVKQGYLNLISADSVDALNSHVADKLIEIVSSQLIKQQDIKKKNETKGESVNA